MHSIYVGDVQCETGHKASVSTGLAGWGWHSPKKAARSVRSASKNVLTFDDAIEAAAGPGIAEYKDGQTQSTVKCPAMRHFPCRANMQGKECCRADSFEMVQLLFCRNCNDWFEDAFALARIQQCTALMHCAKQLLDQSSVGLDDEMLQVSMCYDFCPHRALAALVSDHCSLRFSAIQPMCIHVV